MKKLIKVLATILFVSGLTVAFASDLQKDQNTRAPHPGMYAVKPHASKSPKANKLRRSQSLMKEVEHATGSRMVGSVVYSDFFEEYGLEGLYELDRNTGKKSVIMLHPQLQATGGGVLIGDLYYCVTVNDVGGYAVVMNTIYDMTTGEVVYCEEGDISSVAVDLAYDPTTGNVYGGFMTADYHYYFGTLDLTTWKSTKICDMSTYWNAYACTEDGRLYGIDMNGSFYSIDKLTGEATYIGETGCEPYWTTSACFDYSDGTLYWTVCPEDGSGNLYTVNVETGEANFLLEFEGNEEVVGLCFVDPDADPKAPAAATELEVETQQAALQCRVTARMPTTTFDGTSASGELTAKIFVDNELAATVASTFGATIDQTVEVASVGEHTFALVVANAVGDSPAVKLRKWVGMDSPATPENVKLTYADGQFSLVWDPVTIGAHGGYIVSTNVRYTVRRLSDDTVVATETATTTITDAVVDDGNLAAYTYEVVAEADGLTSAAALSNRVVLGSITLPYTQPFDDQESLEYFTIIDANNDNYTWRYYSGRVRCYISEALRGLDDWLITPPVMLEAGKYYEFAISLNGVTNTDPEIFSIYAGRDATVEGMNIPLLAHHVLCNDNGQVFRCGFVAPESGRFYFGVKGESPDNYPFIYGDNLTISAAAEPVMPAKATDVNFAAAPNGDRSGVLTFTLPTLTAGGQPLTSITKAEVYRDAALLRSYTTVEPGQTISLADSGVLNGYHRYSIVAYNEAGRGMECNITEFCGAHEPKPVTNVVASRTENEGEVLLMWNPSTEDIYGNPLSADNVYYFVRTIDGEGNLVTLAQKLQTNSLRAQVLPVGSPQEFRYFAVYAATDGGSSTYGQSNAVALGKPYDMPYTEPISDGSPASSFLLEFTGDSDWKFFNDMSNPGVTSQNGDNGYAGMVSTRLGVESSLTSGLIKVSGNNPTLEFYYYYPEAGFSNTIEVVVSSLFGDFVETTVNPTEQEPGWVKVSTDLSPYADSVIQYSIKVHSDSHLNTYIDNLRVVDMVDYNMAVTDIQIPEYAESNEPFNIRVTVANNGLHFVGMNQYSLSLYRNGKKVQSEHVDNLFPNERTYFLFEETIPVTCPEQNEYYVEIDFDLDQIETDNRTETKTLTLKKRDYVTPTDLVGSAPGAGIDLSWTAPAEEELVPTTDDFESYTSWATSNIGDWTLVDGDQIPCGAIEYYPMPTDRKYMSFAVFDYSQPINKFPIGWQPRSGNKSLFGMFLTYSGMANDDWLISPLLSGSAQRISVYAISGSLLAPETFQIYYSSTDKDVSSFTLLNTFSDITSVWTEYAVDLPEGAKYFAIRYISNDRYTFFVDDVTYIGATRSILDLIGYNVYRDGEKINDEPVTTTSYHDFIDDEDDHVYVVSAVYEKGESNVSNELVISTVAGIDNVVMDAHNQPVEYYNLQGIRIDSRNITPGFYIRRQGSHSQTVRIR